MTLSYREKILVVLLLVVAVIYLGIQFLIMPAYNSYTNNQSIVSELTDKKLLVQNNVSNVTNINVALQKAQANALNVAKPFLPTLDADILNVWANNIASSNGYTIQSIAITSPKATIIQLNPSKSENTLPNSYPIKDFANKVNGINNQGTAATTSQATAPANGRLDNKSMLESDITLSMTGQFSNVSSFLNAIKNSKRTVNVSSFTATYNDKNVFIFTCTINCYAVQKLDSSDNLVDWNLPAPSGKSVM
jgi:Tfp pilus assembly protein PilO